MKLLVQLLIYQYATLGLAIILFLLWMFMPRSAKVRFRARMSKSGILVSLFSDDGFEHTMLMNADLGQGILTGNPANYLFQPRPTKLMEKEHEDGTKEQVECADVNLDEKELIDSAMKHMCISDTGKPFLLGYVGKSLVVTPQLLELIHKVDGSHLFKRLKGAKEKPIREITLLDPRILKSYMSRTISKSAIESIKFEHERIGFNRKPISDALKKAALPVSALVVIILIAMAWQSGALDSFLSGLGLGG